MKHHLLTIGLLFATLSISAQEYTRIDGRELTLLGKLMPTPNPYNRVDTCVFKGFTPSENTQVRLSSGLALAFKTTSKSIGIKAEYGYKDMGLNSTGIALRGYDLYIRKDGDWIWAASGCPKLGNENDQFFLAKDFVEGEKECLLYLPLYSELYSLELVVDKGSKTEALEAPFSHMVGIFGSSLTQGIGNSRPGMAYPAQFTRHTGIQLLSLGCSGNCKLQSYFADVLCAAEVDALIFDCFSNPNAAQIEERLFPFIEKIQAAHPDIPLIFITTVRREGRNFRTAMEDKESSKWDMAEKLMAQACRKYKNVYFLHTSAAAPDHETSVDGSHPTDEGYRRFSASFEKQATKILRKYGIR